MPVLPRLDTSQSVFSDQPLASQQISASPAAFGGVTAQAAGQLAQGAQQASGQLTDLAVRQQAIQNETDANNQFYKSYFPAASNLTQKYLQLGGKDAVDQKQAYMDQLEQLREQQRGNLTNPLAQRMFDDVSRRFNMFQADGMERHATQQNAIYQDQTSQGMVDASGNLALQRYNDPNAFAAAMNSGTQEIMTHAQFRGEPVEYANTKVAQFTSNLYAKRLQMIAQNDPVGAFNMLQHGETYTDMAGNQQHIDIQAQIGEAQLPSVYDYLQKGAKEVWARDLGQSAVTASGPAIAPGNQSLGVRNNNPGNLKGASGQFQQFGNMQDGISAADANLAAYGSKHGINTIADAVTRWDLGHAPMTPAQQTEVSNYVARVSKATGIGPDDKVDLSDPAVRAKILPAMFDVESPGWRHAQAGGPVSGPTTTTHDLEAELPNKVAAARSAAAQMFPNDPTFADKAASYAEHTGNTILAGVRGQQATATDALTRALVGDPISGKPPVTSMDQIMADPTLKGAWSKLTPQGQLAIQTRLAKPEHVPLTQDGLNTYYRLRGQAANDPNGFLSQDLSTLFGKVPEPQIMELINQQAALRKGDQSQANKSLNWSRTKGDVDDMLKPLGLGSSAKAGSDESATTEQFYGKLEEAIADYQSANQKLPDTATTRKIAAGLLAQGSQAGTGWFGTSSETRAFQSPDLSKFSVPVPEDQKPALASTFKTVMGHAPTDDELAQWYTRYTLSKGRK